MILDVLEELVAIHPSALIEKLEQKGHESELSEAEYAQLLEPSATRDLSIATSSRTTSSSHAQVQSCSTSTSPHASESVKTQSGTPTYQAPDADLTLWDAIRPICFCGRRDALPITYVTANIRTPARSPEEVKR